MVVTVPRLGAAAIRTIPLELYAMLHDTPCGVKGGGDRLGRGKGEGDGEPSPSLSACAKGYLYTVMLLIDRFFRLSKA